MRARHLVPVLLALALMAGGAATVHADGDRQQTFAQAAAKLRAQWDRDVSAGVPAASLAPLRAQLSAGQPTAAWWSPGWLGDDGRHLLDGLAVRTQAAWNEAMDRQRSQARAVLTQWSGFVAGPDGTLLSADSIGTAARWPVQLGEANTPAAVAALVSSWNAFLAAQKTALGAARQARLSAALQAGGVFAGALAGARHLVDEATTANLDPGAVSVLADQLNLEVLSSNPAAPATGKQLLNAMAALQALLDLNTRVGAQVVALAGDVAQAQAEGAASAATFAGDASAITARYRAARTTPQLAAVAQAISALRAQMATVLVTAQCGHAVGAGKVITISLSLQEMVFYQDGCVVRTTAVTTGRPQLPTPTGTFSIFYKKTPFTFISPWPPGSPFYYYPSPVSWVMEFAAGGFFIHDAPWEPLRDYGPGGENNLAAASHGCVHTPTSVMQWAFAWTPLGTPVLISA